MNSEKLRVTVVTPVLNGVKTIKDCIDSVKTQDYPLVDHLIIDGCSTDGTLELLENSGITYTSEADCGIYDAFNKGILAAKGDIIHILNADDYYANHGVISKVVSLMEKGKLDLCHGLVKQITNNKVEVCTIGGDVSKKQLLCKMKAAHPSVFVKREVYSKYGTFSVGFKIAGDHDFLLRIWDKARKGFIPEIFVMMRIGGTSGSQVKLSYRESAAVSIIHGKSIPRAYFRYYYELIKHNYIIVPLRKCGYKN